MIKYIIIFIVIFITSISYPQECEKKLDRIKKYHKLDKILGLDAVVIPEYGFDLGNVSTKIYGSALFRWGWGIPKDYGVTPIDNTTYSKIPLSPDNSYENGWSFCFNFAAKANLIARNIFLDGNSIRESHNVDKNYLTATGSYGFSLNYDQYSLDYIRTHTTKEYKTQDGYFSYGSFILSYNF